MRGLHSMAERSPLSASSNTIGSNTPSLNRLNNRQPGASIPADVPPKSFRTFHDCDATNPNTLLPENTKPMVAPLPSHLLWNAALERPCSRESKRQPPIRTPGTTESMHGWKQPAATSGTCRPNCVTRKRSVSAHRGKICKR